MATAGITAGLAPLAVHLDQLHDRLPTATASAVPVTLVVSADPRPLAAHAVGPARVLLDAQLISAAIGTSELEYDVAVLVVAPASGWKELVPGQRLRATGSFREPVDRPLLGSVLTVADAPQLLGQPPWFQRAATAMRSALRQACEPLPAGPRGLLPGLVVGDTSQLDPVLADRFRVAGLTHLTAVSGTNCAIVVGAVVLLARRLRVGPRLTAVLAAVALLAFVVVARPSPSVVRAALMAGIGLAALATGRAKAVVPALAAAVLAALAWHPQLARDPGFLMSVLATGAIVLLAPPATSWLRSHRVPRGLAELIAVAGVAHLATAPVSVTFAGEISLLAVPANAVAEPVVAAATVFGFLAAVVGSCWSPGGVAFAWLASWPCRWLVWVADWFATAPGATVRWVPGAAGNWLLVVLVVLLVAALWWRRTRLLVLTVAITAVIAQVPVRAVLGRWPPPGWWFVACDVGQGDALVLRAGDGEAVVVDAGPDPVLVDTCLRSLGIRRVRLLLLTHLHMDHIAGVTGVLHDRVVDQVATGPLRLPAAAVQLVQGQLSGRALPLSVAQVGSTLQYGAVSLAVVAPRTATRGSHSDANNSSLVAVATVAERRVLLAGDAELEAESDLLAAGADVRADVIKVPHHGSAYSDPRFLAAANAQLAVISVGSGNDYGHPAPSTLRALAQLALVVTRTDLDGSVAVSAVPEGISVASTGARPGLPAAAGGPATTASALSARSATMTVCLPSVLLQPGPAQPPRKAPSDCTRWSPATSYLPWSCFSVTKSCWSRAPPVLSGRLFGAPIREPN